MKKIILIIIFSILIFILFKKEAPITITEDTKVEIVDTTATEQCFSRSVTATKEEPFSSEEYLKLTFNNDNVDGVKYGFQSGPGYSNGFTGTLTGTMNGADLVVNYTYIVEGSTNTEKEIYVLAENSLERIQYPLVEKNKMLVPDTTKGEIRRLKYTSFNCKEFNKKM